MAVYYVGAGGSDLNDGLSWSTRKATLNGAEDIPVAAGDTVYVGPGVYRETLTCDVSGASGTPITYIADVTGENTDGVGGIVRITGSDDDQTATRTNAIVASAITYRTFRGFSLDTTTSDLISVTNPTNWVLEDIFIQSPGRYALYCAGDSQASVTLRRCVITNGKSNTYTLFFTSTAGISGSGHVIENCIITGGYARGIGIAAVGGMTVRNCLLMLQYCVRVTTALPTGQTTTVNNCILISSNVGLQAVNVGEITEDYNLFWNCGLDRSNVTAGTNSVSYPPLLLPPILAGNAGIKYPWWFGELSEWSAVRALTGSGEATDDLFGITRPATAGKKSWGAIQFVDGQRETTTTYGSSTASIKLADEGRHQVFVPVDATSTTISVYVYREADYAGTAPQMVIKQPGQSDITVTDAGAASTWNQLTYTLTPASSPPYVVVELVSNNTATTGSYAVYFDSLDVS